MAMSVGYRNAIADAGADLITHIGLVDDEGTELSGGSYARKAVTWTAASGGTIRPTADLTFDVPAGATVAGWRGFSASTGGTNYGGADLTEETFAAAGQYKLLAVSTGILHTDAT
jgi:hypothetical protein